MPVVLNKQRRTFVVPQTSNDKGHKSKAVSILPGAYASIEDEIWNQLKTNKAIQALITQRRLVVSDSETKAKKEDVSLESLDNAESKGAPEELNQELDERLTLDSSVAEVDAPKSDAPASTKRSKR
ncbi:hypothetical protein F9L16_23640 [Agarivorans sp. B2Z047]|uniref:hypothetical protein n=1 Tax=Agarivorans sp. B2Z047 TaxID=2652721 RepID=UPI00128D7540|nr:hypothetical protein [Agarivorans sp. B2Z047]MPW31951.1 hypothetical protein [Agarivorans sp. B2Z047]UQN41884.1 hypothetical protein LQZ07_19210 [Agarivorans sp. B2Z047]UQN44883.1 hypothetical protein LQZ07_10585 [Agarivorans sp. B2Z047]